MNIKKQQTYFGLTTAQQRRLLFETWVATGDVALSIQTAKVSLSVFYKWKPRFERGGYEALKCHQSHAPLHPRKKSEEIENKVKILYQNNCSWGKQRIADEIAKENNWKALVSPNTVRRILKDANLWSESQIKKKKG
jgi:transposase